MNTYGRHAPRLAEVGRIRIGDRKGSGPDKRRKLETFRLTCDYSDKPVLEQAAQVYGGAVQAWDNPIKGRSWELYTPQNILRVMVLPSMCITAGHERWTAAGCTRRCDGQAIQFDTDQTKIGTPCECPAEYREREAIEAQRTALSKQKASPEARQALNNLMPLCEDRTRIQVMLPDLDIIATWRLETKSYYGTTACIGQIEVLRMAGINAPTEAMLSITETKVKRIDPTTQQPITKVFLVPNLRILMSPRQLLAPASTPTPVPQLMSELTGEEVMPVVSHTPKALPPPPEPSPQGATAKRAALMNHILASWRKAGLTQQEFTRRLRGMYEVPHVSDIDNLGLLEAIAGWADDGCPILEDELESAPSATAVVSPEPQEDPILL